jgi:hypothetical protein
MKKVSQIAVGVREKLNQRLISGMHQRCIPGSVRYFSGSCNIGVESEAINQALRPELNGALSQRGRHNEYMAWLFQKD